MITKIEKKSSKNNYKIVIGNEMFGERHRIIVRHES